MRKSPCSFLTSRNKFSIMKLPFDPSGGRQGVNTRSLYLLSFIRKQVMYMTGYEITMICIAAMTFLLKLIEFIVDQNKK